MPAPNPPAVSPWMKSAWLRCERAYGVASEESEWNVLRDTCYRELALAEQRGAEAERVRCLQELKSAASRTTGMSSYGYGEAARYLDASRSRPAPAAERPATEATKQAVGDPQVDRQTAWTRRASDPERAVDAPDSERIPGGGSHVSRIATRQSSVIAESPTAAPSPSAPQPERRQGKSKLHYDKATRTIVRESEGWFKVFATLPIDCDLCGRRIQGEDYLSGPDLRCIRCPSDEGADSEDDTHVVLRAFGKRLDAMPNEERVRAIVREEVDDIDNVTDELLERMVAVEKRAHTLAGDISRDSNVQGECVAALRARVESLETESRAHFTNAVELDHRLVDVEAGARTLNSFLDQDREAVSELRARLEAMSHDGLLRDAEVRRLSVRVGQREASRPPSPATNAETECVSVPREAVQEAASFIESQNEELRSPSLELLSRALQRALGGDGGAG